MSSTSNPRRVSVPVSGTALLLIDVINDMAFEGSEALVGQAEPMAAAAGGTEAPRRAAGVPAIYINDNFGQWRSDFRRTVAHCTARIFAGPAGVAAPATDSARLLRAEAEASGFYDTTLDTLLEDAADSSRHPDGHRRKHLRAVHGQRCLYARSQDLRSGRLHRVETAQENEQALHQLGTVLKGNVATSERLVFHRRRLRR